MPSAMVRDLRKLCRGSDTDTLIERYAKSRIRRAHIERNDPGAAVALARCYIFSAVIHRVLKSRGTVIAGAVVEIITEEEALAEILGAPDSVAKPVVH